MAEERVREVWDCSTDRRDGGNSVQDKWYIHTVCKVDACLYLIYIDGSLDKN